MEEKDSGWRDVILVAAYWTPFTVFCLIIFGILLLFLEWWFALAFVIVFATLSIAQKKLEMRHHDEA